MVGQSLVAYWFTLRYGAQPDLLGAIFFVANILAGLSALVAARLAARIGLVRTMVFTHLPSNVLVMALPLMPTLPLAAGVLLARLQPEPDGRAGATVLPGRGGRSERALGRRLVSPASHGALRHSRTP